MTQANADQHDRHAAWSSLGIATWFSLLAHLLAGLAMVAVMRHGLETNPDFAGRLEFISARTPWWIGSWLLWHVAAVSILCFCFCLNRAHEATQNRARSTLGRLAVAVCAAAIATDLAAQAIEIGVVPELASMVSGDHADPQTLLLLRTIRRVVVVLTGYLGNGLYTLAAFLLVISTRRCFRITVVLWGGAVVLSGLALSAAALTGVVAGMFWSNVLLVPCLLLWQCAILLEARRRVHLYL